MILPLLCAATRRRHLAETAKKKGKDGMMDAGRWTVVTAHIIERELMPVGLDHCVETLYHPAGRTDCEQAPSRLLLLHPCRWRHTMPALSSPRGERTQELE